jgi:hypothetical protein
VRGKNNLLPELELSNCVWIKKQTNKERKAARKAEMQDVCLHPGEHGRSSAPFSRIDRWSARVNAPLKMEEDEEDGEEVLPPCSLRIDEDDDYEWMDE